MSDGDINTLILLLSPIGFLLFLAGMQSGKTGEHERQRRLGRVRGRINGLDPAEVTDHLLNTVENALPDQEIK